MWGGGFCLGHHNRSVSFERGPFSRSGPHLYLSGHWVWAIDDRDSLRFLFVLITPLPSPATVFNRSSLVFFLTRLNTFSPFPRNLATVFPHPFLVPQGGFSNPPSLSVFNPSSPRRVDFPLGPAERCWPTCPDFTTLVFLNPAEDPVPN